MSTNSESDLPCRSVASCQLLVATAPEGAPIRDDVRMKGFVRLRCFLVHVLSLTDESK